MGSSVNFLRERNKQLNTPALVLTASNTVTAIQLEQYDDIVAGSTGSITVTLPAAGTDNKGKTLRIANNNSNSLTVSLASGGFGGAAPTSLSLAQGAMAVLYSDGTYWYNAV